MTMTRKDWVVTKDIRDSLAGCSLREWGPGREREHGSWPHTVCRTKSLKRKYLGQTRVSSGSWVYPPLALAIFGCQTPATWVGAQSQSSVIMCPLPTSSSNHSQRLRVALSSPSPCSLGTGLWCLIFLLSTNTYEKWQRPNWAFKRFLNSYSKHEDSKSG